MSLIVGEHPELMTVILVQGSTADLVVPSDVSLAAPALEFAADRAATTATVTHTLALEAGEYVVHLSAAQVAALAAANYARLKNAAGRVLAAGEVKHNYGWAGRTRSGVVTHIIWGGGGGGSGGGVTDHGLLTGLGDDDHPHYYNSARLPEAVQDVVGAMVTAAGGSYNDAAGTITFPSSGGGGGGLSVIDNGDGTLTLIDTGQIVDNGDGTLTLTT